MYHLMYLFSEEQVSHKMRIYGRGIESLSQVIPDIYESVSIWAEFP